MDFINIVGNIVLLNTIVGVCNGGEYCTTGSGSLKYCDDDCCGDDCCDGFTTAQIIGFVIAGLMALATIVGCVVCVVWMCKKANYDRHAVQPYYNGYNHNAVVVHNNAYGHPRPSAPPAYGQHYGYPSQPANPHYSAYNDPVYPPGMVQGNQPPEYHPPPPSYSASTGQETSK